MGLSGNLSALSLPELLQMVAMSRKTGRLEICSDQGVAWLGLSEGGIVRVAIEGGGLDREAVLKRAGLDPEDDSEMATATVWDAAVQALLAIFEWREGEFTFEPAGQPAEHWRGPPGVVLSSPLSPEFLALEGARLEDEGGGPIAGMPPAGCTATATEEADAVPGDPAPAPAAETGAAETSVPDDSGADAGHLRDEPGAGDPPAPALAPAGPVICVDPDLGMLERIKRALGEGGGRVHIFQDGSSALTRLKQYVLRGEFPSLVLGATVPDPVDGGRGEGWQRFARRVSELAPQVRITVIGEGTSRVPEGVGWVTRPRPTTATATEVDDFLASLARALDIET